MIKINTKIINLDVNRKLYEKLVAKQGDTNSRFLLFNLSSGGAAINLTNRSVRVYAVKPDGTEVFNDLLVSDPARGTCILELTTQILAIPGIVKMELMITEGLKKLTSFEFELEVIKKLNSETAIVSTNEFTALVQGLASLSEYDNYKNEIKAARGSFLSVLARLNDSDTKKANVIDVYTKVKVDELLALKTNDTDSNRTTNAKDTTGAINEINGNKVSKTIQSFTPTLINSWVENSATYQPPIYYKDDMGIVHLEGAVTGGSASYVFVLPVGFRPTKHTLCSVTGTLNSKIVPLTLIAESTGNVGLLGYEAGITRVALNCTFKI